MRNSPEGKSTKALLIGSGGVIFWEEPEYPGRRNRSWVCGETRKVVNVTAPIRS